MTISQIGVFEHGTFGYPVQIQLSDSPISLLTATAIHLDCRRPGQTNYSISRDLVIPDDILDFDLGKIQWILHTGELTVRGHYRIVVTVDFAAGPRLTVAGQMEVS